MLLCARVELTPSGVERLEHTVDDTLDWPRVLALADRHGLLALLHRHLDSRCRDAVPRTVLVGLWGRAEMLRRRNAAIAAELGEVLGLFEEHAIAALPYKGPALALAAYGDVALREFGDLDILLRSRDVLRAKEALAARGYLPAYALRPAQEAAFLRSPAQYHLVVDHPSRAPIELHWKTDPDFTVEPGDDRWWDSLATTGIAGRRARCFSDAELLLVLSLHAAKHRWASLGWLVDIAEWIRRNPALDWSFCFARAEALGCARRFALGLVLARDLLGLDLPADALARMRVDPEASRLAKTIAAELLEVAPVEPGPWTALVRNLRMLETHGQRFAHCVNYLFRPSLVEWTRWPLPPALAFLYPGLRFLRLASKHLAGGVALARAGGATGAAAPGSRTP